MRSALTSIGLWFDGSAQTASSSRDPMAVDWLRVSPFLALHLSCIGVFWTGWSPVVVAVAAALYVVRMFAITGFYHRYFSHRSFKTSRTMQLVFAIVGASAAQRGPLWWAAHHREHHADPDGERDPHSPSRRGFLWSHMLWFLTPDAFRLRSERVRDLLRFPELRLLDRYDILVPLLLAAGLFLLGHYLEIAHPALSTGPWQMLVWGFCISTVALFHGTVTINSLCHMWGSRRYATRDNSRNNALLSLLTLGEGWHNNHHFYPAATRQGHRWWEFDPTFYGLWLLARLGLIRDLKPVPDGLSHSATEAR